MMVIILKLKGLNMELEELVKKFLFWRSNIMRLSRYQWNIMILLCLCNSVLFANNKSVVDAITGVRTTSGNKEISQAVVLTPSNARKKFYVHFNSNQLILTPQYINGFYAVGSTSNWIDTSHNQPLWRIMMKDVTGKKQLNLNSINAEVISDWHVVRQNVFSCCWQVRHEKMTLRVTAYLKTIIPAGRLEWRINVQSDSPDWCLKKVEYPIASLKTAIGKTSAKLVVPLGLGLLVNDPVKVLRGNERDPVSNFTGFLLQGAEFRRHDYYPGIMRTMQFMAYLLGKRGLYIATEDPDCNMKRFVTRAPNALNLYIGHFPEASNTPLKRWTLPYSVVWQQFSGSWYEAAMLYRKWVLPRAPWCSKGKLQDRKDIPEWSKTIPLWLNGGWSGEFPPKGRVPANKVVERLSKAAEKLGVPFAFQWYGWHDGVAKADIGTPVFLPAYSGFADACVKLHKKNIKVVPYVNARLLDRSRKDYYVAKRQEWALYEDPDWKDIPPKKGCKRPQLADACSYAPGWQNFQKNQMLDMKRLFNVDGIYLDQVAAACPKICFSNKHGHKPGSPTAWALGYRQMLKKMCQADPTQAICVEGNAECYLDYTGLLCICPVETNIPLFQAVYGGYARMYGGIVSLENNLSFYQKIGDQFLFGLQLGFIPTFVESNVDYSKRPGVGYLSRLAKYRMKTNKFLSFGKMLCPPSLGSQPKLKSTWDNWGVKTKVIRPAVAASAWCSRDGNTAIFLVNTVKDEKKVNLYLRVKEYCPGGKAEISPLINDGGISKRVIKGKVRLPVTVPGHDAVVLLIKPSS